ncbi:MULTISPECIES: GtrA family protein [unclassified Lysobacter]|uniref:GtrA family protein n=1 Tax=unclassified Lysobacter TaxID=2635362 RepID=UPI001C21BC9D|nr:GtrA family protein [Lysobacter sp. MMG2]MBU8977586.1 GtrA family protein [Lysobacter sp. MMG2]
MRRWFSGSPLVRQGSSYLVIGLLQLLVDWAMFVSLSAMGLAVEPANVLGRVSGAVLGFWLNGRVTFAGEDTKVGRRQFARFLTMWIATTVVSTWSLGHVDDTVGLQWAWVAKPAIELVLASVGFVLSRHWVYRR